MVAMKVEGWISSYLQPSNLRFSDSRLLMLDLLRTAPRNVVSDSAGFLLSNTVIYLAKSAFYFLSTCCTEAVGIAHKPQIHIILERSFWPTLRTQRVLITVQDRKCFSHHRCLCTFVSACLSSFPWQKERAGRFWCNYTLYNNIVLYFV